MTTTTRYASVLHGPAAILVVFALLLLAGCQALPSRPMASFDEIVQMSKDGRSGAEIIAVLEQRRLPPHLSGSQLGRLKEQGVPDEVLDYLMATHTNNVRYQTRLDAEPYWWYHPFYYRPHQVIVVERPRR